MFEDGVLAGGGCIGLNPAKGSVLLLYGVTEAAGLPFRPLAGVFRGFAPLFGFESVAVDTPKNNIVCVEESYV